MFSTTDNQYHELWNARPALTSFAPQIVKDQPVREGREAVHTGLHTFTTAHDKSSRYDLVASVLLLEFLPCLFPYK